MFTQFHLTSPSTLKRKVRHKNAALSAQVRRRVRRVKGCGFAVVARVKLCVQISNHPILARVKIMFLRKPRFEITFGGRGLSRYDMFLV
jgi:hypothetical protein